ncbi:hypothetical protein CUR178_00432 [Leishmania enriettii]|uniref:Uncharacterized protein n=1 Tax=Leishmania enriettii TaxID=5663 RepID=A0A836GHZ0_LEIEN|nr:hypothetical protein CUR178_00432 [Leishmania enriettii]
MPHAARGSFAAPMPTPPDTDSAGHVGSMLSAAAAVPSYVPGWAMYSKKYGLYKSSFLCEAKGNNALCLSRATACSLSHWGGVGSACQEDREGDDEVDVYTHTGLTHSSSATTTTTTPTSRTAACTPSSAANESHYGSGASESATVARPIHVNPAARREGWFPSAEELTRFAQGRYGASPARLLLRLWRFLSDDAFVGGYQVADAFGDDLVWCSRDDPSNFNVVRTQLPSMLSLKLAAFAGRPSTDLSATAFRLPELMALFRSSSTSLENMICYQRYPLRAAPTMFSIIFVDARLPTAL